MSKVSQKTILPYLEEITPLIAGVRIAIEKMPDCTRKKSLFVTLAAFEKKIQVHARELSEEAVTAYVGKHPELLQKLAHFAASDKGATEISKQVVTPEEIPAQKEHKKKRF